MTKGQPITFAVLYDNVGKLPAVDLYEHYLFRSLPSADIDSGAAMSQVSAAGICAGIEPSKDAEVVYPSSGGVKMTVSVKPIDPQTGKPPVLYDDLMSGDHSLIVLFCIAYKTLDQVHHSEFCYFYRPGFGDGVNLDRCDKGNKAD